MNALIPPSLFGGVARLLAHAGLAERARVAVEKPFGHDLESARELESAARVAALAAIAPVSPQLVVRGQYAGYREIEGVARESQTEIFIALRLDVDKPRWRGVPFCLRAGKRLPLTTTKAFARYGPPAGAGCASHVRIRIGPGAVGVGLGSLQRSREDAARELRTDLGRDEDRDAYVSLLDAALRGDSSYAERADGVPAAWRAVEPALRTSLPVHRYSGGSWGPAEADRVPPLGERWHELAPVD